MKLNSFNLLKGFLDIYEPPHHIKKRPSLFHFIYNTIKYKLAESGIYLTENEKKLSNFKNIHKGQRCFIIGNGPSLNKLDLEKLKDEYTFGVNCIFMNYNKMKFHPTYYVVEDIFVAEDRSKEINAYNEPTKFIGNCLKYCIEENDNTIWLNVLMRYDDYPNFPNFSTNALRRVWVGGTVSYICMQLAFYMGFTAVYLIGFDHSYKIPKDINQKGNILISTSDDPNHFNNNYFGKGYRWHDPRLDRMEKAYKKARYKFEEDGREIYNATAGGNLEIFKRVEYADLF